MMILGLTDTGNYPGSLSRIYWFFSIAFITSATSEAISFGKSSFTILVLLKETPNSVLLQSDNFDITLLPETIDKRPS